MTERTGGTGGCADAVIGAAIGPYRKSRFNPFGIPAITGDPPGPFPGPKEPSFSFQSSDFWAQGLNVGLAFRF